MNNGRGISGGLAGWCGKFRALAAVGAAGTPFGDAGDVGGADVAGFIEGFRDEAGHRRRVDRPFLAAALGVSAGPTPAVIDPETRLWWALHDAAVGLPAEARAGSEGPLLPALVAQGIEAWTEAELSGLHALWHHAHRDSGTDAALLERCVSAARWLIAELQPDNATNRPWGIQVFAWLAEARGDGDARMYAETQLHNAMFPLGRADRLSACILMDGVRGLEKISG